MSDRSRIISVIPVYNGERFIRATLDSLAAQTLRPDRVIVLDDASTDGTARLVETYEPLNCELIRSEQNEGLFNNFNKALGYATGCDYLHYICADDVLLPEFMKRGLAEAPKAVHDPAERIKDQDRDNVAAEVIYSSTGMPLFSLADAAFRATCFRAFNDWDTDYCQYDLKRLIPLGLITLEDIPSAVPELERIQRRGMAGAMIWGEAPADQPYSHPDYDPFWAKCIELGVAPIVLRLHCRCMLLR